jgi:hypothetical protein
VRCLVKYFYLERFAKGFKEIVMAGTKGGSSLARLRSAKKSLEAEINYEELLQELNPEDHPVQKSTSRAEVKRSEERVKKKEAKLRSITRQIAKKLASSKGGAGGGGMNLASRGRSRSLLQQIKDSSGPLNE